MNHEEYKPIALHKLIGNLIPIKIFVGRDALISHKGLLREHLTLNRATYSPLFKQQQQSLQG